MTSNYFPNYKQKKPWYRKPGFFFFLMILAGIMGAAYWVFKVYPMPVLKLVDTPQAVAQEEAKKAKKADQQPRSAEVDSAKAEAVLSKRQKIQKSDELKFREEKIAQIQKDVIQSLYEIRTIQKSLDETLKKQKRENRSEQNLHLAKLIKIVGSMAGEQAALVITQMEEDLAVNIMASLSGAKSSKIMAGLEPEKAARISKRMVALKPDAELKNVMDNWKTILEEEAEREKNERYPSQEPPKSQ